MHSPDSISAAGAMVYLVATEFILEALVTGADLRRSARNLLASNEMGPAVDDYTFIYDLDEMPAPPLADR